MKKLLLLFVLFGLFFQANAQRNYAAKKLLFSQVQKPYINYGYLYNWFVIIDTRNICASGWHVPTQTEWNTLLTYLGGQSIAGGKLKEVGTIYWNSPNTGATNEVKFNLRGNGYRLYPSGSFISINTETRQWTSTPSGTSAYFMQIFNNAEVVGNTLNNRKEHGESIRLIKDSTTLIEGQSGIYIGNDGKIYRTICINGVEWLADNLAETKYRNGDWIAGYDNGIYTPISDLSWASLTTGAMCIYNNNESYR